MNILDRYILKTLSFNYLVALGLMLSLYVLLDLFVNLDEFTEQQIGAFALIGNIIDFYVPNLFLYFSQLSGVITLFACVLTIARMRRFRELIAVLASGVSLYRVAAPVILFGTLTTGLLIVDTEWMIPHFAAKLARRHDEVGTNRAYSVALMRDASGKLLSAAEFSPATRTLRRPVAIVRNADGGLWKITQADQAQWEPIPGHPNHGRWRLLRGMELTRTRGDSRAIGPIGSKQERLQSYLETDLDPETIQMRQSEQWVGYLSLAQLDDLRASRPPNLHEVEQARHARIATPMINFILMLLGLPFFLDRWPGNVARDATWCLVVCGLCYITTFAARSVLPEWNSPLPAWIPIMVFGPIAMVLLDRIRT